MHFIYEIDICISISIFFILDHPEDEIPLLDDMTTTVRPTPGFILTTTTISPVTQLSQDCVHDDQVFADGALIKTEKACEHCYCMKGDIVCVVQECGTPMENEGKNCTSLPPREGQCCPDTYICEGDESSTDYISDITTNIPFEELTTLTPPRRVGVEGSGYRNEPDEIPLTELAPPTSEAEGSGEEKTIVPSDVTSETSAGSAQTQSIAEQSMTTIESVSLATPKTTPEGELEQNTVKLDEGTEKPEVINYEKSTIESITLGNLDKVPHDTVQESEMSSTDSNKQLTETQKETETTEEFMEQWKTTSSDDFEHKTMSPTQMGTKETTGLDKKEYADGLSKPTSSSIYVEGESVPSEKIVVETTTSDSKIGSENEIYDSTPLDSHTLTLEEVEKDESEMDKHKVDTEKSTEEFTTESHDYMSSSDTSFIQETEPDKTHNGANEGFDKEITDTHEFIPVTTSFSTIGVTTEIYKEDDITEKEPDQGIYETPHHITTNTPDIKIESTTQIKGQEVSEEAEKYVTPEIKEILTSTTGMNEFAETSKVEVDVSLDKTTTSKEYISSITDAPISSSERTQKTTMPEEILSDHKITTIIPTLEGKDDITTTITESKIHPTTAAEIETSIADLTTIVPEHGKESQTLTPVTDEKITPHDIKYDTTSKLPLPEVNDDTTTEPDKGINTIPADGIDEDLNMSMSVTSASESYTRKDELFATTESGLIKDDVENKNLDKSSTETSVEKESSTIQIDLFETTALPKEKQTIHEPGDYSNTDHVPQTTTEFLSLTTVPKVELEKESSTELTIEKTDTPILSINQGENEIPEDILVPGRIPGEGDCLLNGVTYRNESNVPSTHNCHTGCKCISSIIKCDPIICSPPPDYMDNCQPTYDPPDACCPTYECIHVSKETMPPQPQSQMSGTEAPVEPPLFECRGDQCEINEDKLQPTISHESCAGAECKADLDKKPETSECGPHGCDHVEEIPVPQEVDSGHTQICTDGKCTTQIETCGSGGCHPETVDQSETLPTSILENCEIEGNCKEILSPPSLPCEGDKCTNQISETDVKVICEGEGGCLETTYECEGESCRRKEIVDTEVKLPTACTGTKCLEQSDITTEHVDSVPSDDIAQTGEQISHVTVSSTEDQITDLSPDVVHEILTAADKTETPEIITKLPDVSTDKITTQTEVTLVLSSESPTKDETKASELDTKDYVTEKSNDIVEESSPSKPEDHVTEQDLVGVSKDDEIKEDDIGTKIPELVDIQNTLSPHDKHEYTTEIYSKEVIPPSTQESTDIEKGETTEQSDTSVANETIAHEISLDGQTTELPYEQDKPHYKPDVTESHEVDISHQFTTEHIYSTVDEGLPEIVTQPQPIPEFSKDKSTDNEKQMTDSVINIDATSTAIPSEIVDRTTPQEAFETNASKISYIPVESHEETTESLESDITTKSADSVVSMITIPEKHQVGYEKTTMKSEIYSTELDKEAVITYRPDKGQKVELPVTSEIDKEEYITEEPNLSGISEENLSTTPTQFYETDLQSQTRAPEQNEAVTQESLFTGPEIIEIDHEIGKDILTTESTKTSKSEVTESAPSVDIQEQKVPEIQQEIVYEYTTSAATILPSTSEDKHKEFTMSIQGGVITEDTLSPVTDKIYTELTERKTEKPVDEYTATEISVSVPESDEDIYTVTEHKDISPGENLVTKLPEQFIPTEPDFEKMVTNVMTEEEKEKITTLEDKILHLDQETTTKVFGADLDSQSKIPLEEDLILHKEDGPKVSESVSTTPSPILQYSEHLTVIPEDKTIEVPHKDANLLESETLATTLSSILKENETESSTLLEFERKSTVTPYNDDKEQKTTNIPPTTKSEHEIKSESQEDLTTDRLIPELSVSTVSETDYKENEIAPSATTTLLESVTEYAKITEKQEFDKETDIESTSFNEEGKLTTSKIEMLPDSISTSTEQPTATSVDDYGVKNTGSTQSEILVDVSTESTYKQQTQLPESLSHKPEDVHTLSPEIESTPYGKIETMPPLSVITDAPKVEIITSEKDVHEDDSTKSSIENEKQEISSIYTQETTEKDLKFTEKISEHDEENTIPLLSTEYTSSPKYEYPDSTSDLVELEELTHKFLEESPTTSSAASSEDESSHTESTEKTLVGSLTSVAPITEEKTSASEETILEENKKMTHSTSEQGISDVMTTENVLVDITTLKPKLNIEEEISHTDKTAEDSVTSHLDLEKITFVTEKILEESVTSGGAISEKEKEYTVTPDKISEDIETTHRVSTESYKETGHLEDHDKILEVDTVTTQSPTVTEGTSFVHDSEKVSVEITTTLLPDKLEEPVHLVNTENVLEDITTTLSSGLEKETSYFETTERVSEEVITTSRSEEETYKESATDKLLEDVDKTLPTSSEMEVSQSEDTDNLTKQGETTTYPSSEKESSHSYATSKISEETEITPLPTVEEGSKTLENAGTTQPTLIEGEISYTEDTDKILKDTATTLYPGVKETYAESTSSDITDVVTSIPFSTSEETISGENADKDLEQSVTTQQLQEETSHGEFTENILDEDVSTIRPSTEEKESHTITTEKQEVVTLLQPSHEKEVSQNKISEESTTRQPTSEMVTGHDISTDKIKGSTISRIPGFEKDMEQSGSTTPYTSSQESIHFIDTEKTLIDITTTQIPGFEEETSHIESTDKTLEQISSTLPPTIGSRPDHSITTEKILESAPSQSPSLIDDISHAITTEKIQEELAPSLYPTPEDENINDRTTLNSEVITTEASFKHETGHADVTEKVVEDSLTTTRVSLEEDSQKLEPQPEFVTEKAVDEHTEKDIDTPTKIEEESKTPLTESTVTSLPTESLTSETSSQPAIHSEETSSPSSVTQETNVQYQTENQVISTVSPPKHVEDDKTQPETEEKYPQIKPQEILTPGEEVISATTKVTTMSIEEDVTTHATAHIDKFTKPEEKPIEDTQATVSSELPKPSGIQPTDEVPPPEEESHFPPSGTSGYGGETDYGDEDQAFGPGTCRYGGKVYVSAQQIPRDDPCDFCFCFRSDIICLQQSCPPPIHGCHEEPIQGFCCPRYECPVSMATTLNVTTTTTTTTTTLPPHFPTHSYKGAAQRRGCQIKGHTYKVGEVVRASSGPCLHCT